MAKQSPFQGMDPFLEAHWHDVHSRLINRVSEQIAEQLPEDLIVSIEQSITLGDNSEHSKRSDVDVSGWGDTTNWEDDWNPVYDIYESDDGTSNVAEPTILTEDEPPHRYLEIRSTNSGRAIVTVIEILSPANKFGNTGRAYQEKRATYLKSKMNFVEIDLLRQGGPVFSVSADPANIPPYLIFVKRFQKLPEVYGAGYIEPLPRFRIPLRPKDLPAILDLQAAIDECYRAGQYWKRVDYQSEKRTPTPSEERSKLMESIIDSET